MGLYIQQIVLVRGQPVLSQSFCKGFFGDCNATNYERKSEVEYKIKH